MLLTCPWFPEHSYTWRSADHLILHAVLFGTQAPLATCSFVTYDRNCYLFYHMGLPFTFEIIAVLKASV